MTHFASDRTSSNKAGVTLMNNQVGYVVADVMRGKENVDVTELPSMIRVDGVNQIDFDYEEIAEALGWDDFGNNDFEEIMSTHYGRMVVLDDRVLDVRQPGGRRRVHRLRPPSLSSRRSCMYEKDGEKYFIFDTHLHFWDASPENWVQGRRGVREGLDRVLPRLPGPRAGRRRTGRSSTSRSTRWSDFEKDVFIDGHVDMAVFQSTYLKEWYTNGLQRRSSRTPRCWSASRAS